MTNQEFMIETENSFNRSRKILLKKGVEYSGEFDRLENFKRAGAAQAILPEQALWAMAMKHVISISDMVKHPADFTKAQWYEKTGDLRNYMVLLDALLIDGVKE